MPTTSATVGSRTGRTDFYRVRAPASRQPQQDNQDRQRCRDPEGGAEAGKEGRNLRRAGCQGGVAPGLEQQDQHRRAGDRAERAGHHHQAAGHAAVGARDRCRDDVEIRDLEQPDAEALQCHRARQHRNVRRHIGRTDQHLANRHEGRANHRQQTWRNARREPCGKRRRNGGAGRGAGEQQARRVRADAAKPAEIERHQQQHGEPRQVQRRMPGVQQREVEVAKEPQVDDRPRRASFLRDKADRGEDTCERGDCANQTAACGVLQLVQRQQHRADRQYQQQTASGIEMFALRRAHVARQQPAQQKSRQSERDAEPEHRRPVDQRHQKSGDRRTQRTTEPDDHRVDAKDPCARGLRHRGWSRAPARSSKPARRPHPAARAPQAGAP